MTFFCIPFIVLYLLSHVEIVVCICMYSISNKILFTLNKQASSETVGRTYKHTISRKLRKENKIIKRMQIIRKIKLKKKKKKEVHAHTFRQRDSCAVTSDDMKNICLIYRLANAF